MTVNQRLILILIPILLLCLSLPLVVSAQTTDNRTCLAASCDSLLARQKPHGAYADINAAWWEAGIATRALLAGYQILGDQRYLEAVELTINSFLNEQNYDGGWCSYALETILPVRRNSLNTADLACMIACFPLVTAHLSPEKASECRMAHDDYIQHFLPRHDLSSGAFCNGWFEGTYFEFPYSVATATQAVNFVSLYQSTRRAACLRRAESAIRFLLANWHEDGSMTLCQYNRQRTKKLPTTEFQNSYYILEAIIWFYNNTPDEALKIDIRTRLLNYLWGEAGLIAQIRDTDWIGTINGPGRAKALGMLGILSGMERILGPVAGVSKLLESEVVRQCEALSSGMISETSELAFLSLSLAQLVDPVIGVMGEQAKR